MVARDGALVCSRYARGRGGHGPSPGFLQTPNLVLTWPAPLLELLAISEHAREFMAGGIAEAVSRILLHPLETIKVREQMSSAIAQKGVSFGMFQGLGESLAGAVPTTAAFAMMYKMMQHEAMKHFSEEVEGPISVCCATLATTIASIVEEPLELIKQRLQSGISSSFGQAVSDATRQKGVLGLWSGLRSTLARDLPFDALEFALYEQLRKVYSRHVDRESLKQSEMLMAGVTTGALVGLITLPMDVLMGTGYKLFKQLLDTQVDGFILADRRTVGLILLAVQVRTRVITQPMKYSGVRQTVRLLVAEEGVGSLFKGVQQRVLKEAIDSGLFFLVYENLHKFFAWEADRAKA